MKQIPEHERVQTLVPSDLIDEILKKSRTALFLSTLLSNVPGNILQAFYNAKPLSFHKRLSSDTIETIAAHVSTLNVNLQNEKKQTMLHLQPNRDSFMALVKLNADLNMQDENGLTPVMQALKDSILACDHVSELWPHINKELQDNKKNNLLHYAFENGNKFQSLLQFSHTNEFISMFRQGNQEHLIPIHPMLRVPEVTFYKLLSSIPNLFDMLVLDDEPFLFYAIQHAKEQICDMAVGQLQKQIQSTNPKEDKKCIWHYLLSRFYDRYNGFNIRNFEEYLPQINHEAMIEGIPTTPLMLAIGNATLYSDTLTELMENDAKILDDFNVFDVCLKHLNERKKFLSEYVVPNQSQLLLILRQGEYYTPDMQEYIDLAMEHVAPVLQVLDGEHGTNVMHLLCQQKRFDDIEWFMRAKNDSHKNDIAKAFTTADSKGNTVLHYLVPYGKQEQKKIRNYMTKILEYVGSEEENLLNHQNADGETALMLACKDSITLVMSMLLTRGTNGALKDSKGQSAADFCSDDKFKTRLNKQRSKTKKRKADKADSEDEAEKRPTKKQRKK